MIVSYGSSPVDIYTIHYMYVGVLVRFAELHYNVTEGSDVVIVILADKPANKNFSVLLTTMITQSTTAASSTYVY